MGKNVEKKRGCLPIIALVALVAASVLLILSFYPRTYMGIIEESARRYGLSESLVCAVIKTESGFAANAVSHKGAKGLMQIMDTTGEWGFLELGMDGNFSPELLFEPEINVEIGCWYLNKLITQFEDTDAALAAYNAGSGNVASWLKNPDYYDGETLYNIPYAETRIYIRRVKANAKIYEMINGIIRAF